MMGEILLRSWSYGWVVLLVALWWADAPAWLLAIVCAVPAALPSSAWLSWVVVSRLEIERRLWWSNAILLLLADSESVACILVSPVVLVGMGGWTVDALLPFVSTAVPAWVMMMSRAANMGVDARLLAIDRIMGRYLLSSAGLFFWTSIPLSSLALLTWWAS
jgi:hypothetical protein